MIRYNSLCALRIVLAHHDLAVSKLAQLIAGRAAATIANTIVRPAIDQLLECELVALFEFEGVRYIRITPLGIRYIAEIEVACQEAA